MQIKTLEDRLLLLKFTRFEGPELEESLGCIAALESCIEKHKKGWTVEQFKQHLEKHKSEGLYGDYIDGFMSVLERNIREMESETVGSE
ncbi:hypothetical protein CDFC105_73440 [Clostridioides difficile]|uniref:hypothetical protein n=1 Tax=Clostridioides sp. ZZV14-6150 TaxID=2811493 RepID=UPI0007BB8876|nr:hypothetical protein [Clostridioides sp. ZZV14-6150]CZR97682.1 hypothetical protein CDFC105_62475 [Clostridioides difficile]CZS10290.1 hypothetical protein CDFC105_73440 [Clostridioides difficile]